MLHFSRLIHACVDTILRICKRSRVFLRFSKNYKEKRILFWCPRLGFQLCLHLKTTGMFFSMTLVHQLNLDTSQHPEKPKESFPIYSFSVPFTPTPNPPSKYRSNRWFWCDAPEVNRCEFWWNNKRTDLCHCCIQTNHMVCPPTNKWCFIWLILNILSHGQRLFRIRGKVEVNKKELISTSQKINIF